MLCYLTTHLQFHKEKPVPIGFYTHWKRDLFQFFLLETINIFRWLFNKSYEFLLLLVKKFDFGS
jgi:hypothetical protein